MKSPKQTNMALVLSHTDDFEDFFSDRFIESEFNDIYLNYERLNLQDGIEIPNTLCDILYSSLIQNGESGFTSFDVDWAQFRSTLLYDYVMKFKPDEQELKYKQKTNIADEIEIAMGEKEVPLKEFQKMNEFELLTDLFTESVKISWTVYLEYMPVEKYGLPAKNILDWLINNVFNIHNHENIMIPEESHPYVIKTYDPYGLSKEIEIKYLKRLLAERGVDPDDQMAQDGFLDIKLQLEEGLRSDPQSIIASPPSVKLGTFRYFKEIADQVNEGLKNYLDDVSNSIPDTEYDTQRRLVWIYCDYFFNGSMSFDDIDDDIEDKIDVDSFNDEKKRSPKQEVLFINQGKISLIKNARENIRRMCEYAGIDFDSYEGKPEELLRERGRPPKK